MSDDEDKPYLRRVVINGVELFVLTQPLDYRLPDTLSDAEREVVRLVLAGRSNQEIADERGTASQTVANQLYAIYRKLGVNSRAEMVTALEK